MFTWFNKISWSLQLLVGLTLFGVTAVLEALVLDAYLGSALLAVFVAAGLEASKVLAVVLYRVLRGQTEVPYPRSVRWMTVSFRTMLLVLSGVCSLMFLAQHLDRPRLEAVRAADLAAAQAQYEEDQTSAQKAYVQRREQTFARLSEQEHRERDMLAERYLPAIKALEAKLDAEMNNVVGGEFQGKRYRALESRLQHEKDAYARASTNLDQTAAERQAEVIERLEQERRSELARLAQNYQTRTTFIRNDSYIGDARVEHPMALAFVNVLGAVFHRQPSTLQFVLVFSLFLSVTMELGIWVAFEHLTLARLPVFAAEHRAELYVGSKAAETDSELRGFALEEALAQEKVRRKRRSIQEVLREHLDDKLASDDGQHSPVI